MRKSRRGGRCEKAYLSIDKKEIRRVERMDEKAGKG